MYLRRPKIPAREADSEDNDEFKAENTVEIKRKSIVRQ